MLRFGRQLERLRGELRLPIPEAAARACQLLEAEQLPKSLPTDATERVAESWLDLEEALGSLSPPAASDLALFATCLGATPAELLEACGRTGWYWRRRAKQAASRAGRLVAASAGAFHGWRAEWLTVTAARRARPAGWGSGTAGTRSRFESREESARAPADEARRDSGSVPSAVMAALRRLDLPPSASVTAVRSAFRQRIQVVHPDRVASSDAEKQAAAHRETTALLADYQVILGYLLGPDGEGD